MGALELESYKNNQPESEDMGIDKRLLKFKHDQLEKQWLMIENLIIKSENEGTGKIFCALVFENHFRHIKGHLLYIWKPRIFRHCLEHVRLWRLRTPIFKKALDKKHWLSIWKPHKYYGMHDREFCVLCQHSKEWHVTNQDWCEPKDAH